MNRVLRHLLGDRRMTLARDEERGFRVEGLFELDLGARGPGARDRRSGDLDLVVAGARFDRVSAVWPLARKLAA